jgi:hypothetical protein
MRSEILDLGTFRSRSDDAPDGFRCRALAPDLSLSADSLIDCTLIDLGCFSPLINRAHRPHRTRDFRNALPFTSQVGNHPLLLADLKIFQCESDQFGASQAAANERR